MKHLLRDRVNPRRLTRTAGAGWVAALVTLGGCDGGSDHLASEVELLQTRLEAMHTAGGAPAPEGHRTKVYNEMIAKVQELSKGATEAQQSTLALIGANAKAGLAEIESDHVRAKIADVTRAGSLVRSALDLYTTQHALADSMLGRSPSEDLSSLDDQTLLIETRMAQTRKTLAGAEQELAALVGEAAALEAQAKVERDQAARLRVESLAEGTGSRAAMIEEAKDHLIAAAEFERQMAETQIEIDRVTPIAEGAEDEIARLQRQLDRIAMSRTTIREMDQELTRLSESARKQANEAGTEVARRFEALVALVDEELVSAYESAMSKYNGAIGDAGRARDANDRSMQQLVSGSIAASMAALAQSHAEAMGHLAGIVREIETVKPSLAGRDRYTQAREKYEAIANEASDVFTQSAQRASGSYRGAGSGASREVFTSIAEFYDGIASDGEEMGEPDDEMGDPGDGVVEPAPDA